MNWEKIENELEFSTSRSGGKGGQHVNKVESRVQVYFNIARSQGLLDHEKHKILTCLKTQIDKESILQIQEQSTRSQSKNKEKAIKRLRSKIENALKKKKKRIPTKIPKKVIEKRLKNKHIQSEKKKWRSTKEY